MKRKIRVSWVYALAGLAALALNGCGENGQNPTETAVIKYLEGSGQESAGQTSDSAGSAGQNGASAGGTEQAGGAGQESASAGSAGQESASAGGAGQTGGEQSGGQAIASQPQVPGSAGENIRLAFDADTSALDDSYQISDLLYGIFLEDINYAVDGGLYAEMVKNRSFEFGPYASGANQHGWSVTDRDAVSFEVADGSGDGTAIHANNPHYAVVKNSGAEPAGISNGGFLDGMAVTGGAEYRFSAFIKGLDGYSGPVTVRLADGSGVVYAEAETESVTGEWRRYELTLVPEKSVSARLSLSVCVGPGSAALDMVSLFPADTYKGRENGVRRDLAEYLEALSPSFLRFPGGCAVEGRDLDSMYSWKDSIGNGEKLVINGVETTGDVAVRPQAMDIWKGDASNPYYMTYGLGFYEYFLLCEDLGCLGVPVLNAGMTCPIQSERYQAFMMDSEEFAQCIQDALDLVEFCRGGEDTVWGAVRAAMGHPEPFELRYIGIGNEQWQGEYYAHYLKFKEAFAAAAAERPELFDGIELIVANGPSSGDRFAWDRIGGDADYAGLVDEHYYESPDWLKSNVNRYDSYDRDSVPVFLGEYAGKANNMEAALAEAAFMTGLEKNGDIVKMACYAPLFGNETAVQWTPDLIWFDNHSVYGSANYYIQKLFMNHVGQTYIPAQLTGVNSEAGLSGKVGLGTWSTSAVFDDLKVASNATGEVLYEESFDGDSVDCQIIAGSFKLGDGHFTQSSTAAPKYENTGDVAYFGDASWQDYTMTVKATKTGGAEGFLIPVAVRDRDNNIFWNIGGWGNTVSCLQSVSSGVKSGQLAGTVSNLKLSTGKEYELKVEVTASAIRCYIDGRMVVDYVKESAMSVYQSVSKAADGSLIVKLVNVTEYAAPVTVAADHFDGYAGQGTLYLVDGKAPSNFNSLRMPDNVKIEESEIGVGAEFVYELPPYSAAVIWISRE